MINDRYGLLVFTDTQPSEQLDPNQASHLCFVAVLCLDPASIAQFNQYKDTPATDRPSTARELAAILAKNKAFRAAGFLARPKAIRGYGKDFLSTVPETVMEKVGSGYKVEGKKLGEKIVGLLPWYAAVLSLVGLRAAIWANRLKIDQSTLVLDQLPGSPSTAMEIVRRLSHHPELFPLWKKTEETYGVKIQITNMRSFEDATGEKRLGNAHPCMVLADWLAHSVFAASTDAEELDGEANRDEEYRSALVEPWFALYEDKRFDLIPVNRLQFGSSDAPNNSLEPTWPAHG